MFGRRASVLFKRIQVVRFLDEARNALVYLTYSDRLIDGSPQEQPLGGGDPALGVSGRSTAPPGR